VIEQVVASPEKTETFAFQAFTSTETLQVNDKKIEILRYPQPGDQK
jgi:hypothetical protein